MTTANSVNSPLSGTTGTGNFVGSTSASLTTPALGTPSAGVLTSCTGLPMTTGVTGTLGVGNGGTGTATTFTQGSVVFAGASGIHSQDNAKFFWDDTNFRLGIGTATPESAVQITGERNNTPGTKGIHLGMNSGADVAIELCASTSSQSSYIDFNYPGQDFRGRILYSNATDAFSFQAAAGTYLMTFTQGLQMGSPTGGDKGAGTINVAGDIFKNNTAYTNPDYVLEMWATGKIVKFADNEGAKGYVLPSIKQIEKSMRETYRLPRMTDKAMGSFERQDWLLEKLEEAFICIIELKNKIEDLENKIAK
jgi:hypothetical protein